MMTDWADEAASKGQAMTDLVKKARELLTVMPKTDPYRGHSEFLQAIDVIIELCDEVERLREENEHMLDDCTHYVVEIQRLALRLTKPTSAKP